MQLTGAGVETLHGMAFVDMAQSLLGYVATARSQA